MEGRHFQLPRISELFLEDLELHTLTLRHPLPPYTPTPTSHPRPRPREPFIVQPLVVHPLLRNRTLARRPVLLLLPILSSCPPSLTLCDLASPSPVLRFDRPNLLSAPL